MVCVVVNFLKIQGERWVSQFFKFSLSPLDHDNLLGLYGWLKYIVLIMILKWLSFSYEAIGIKMFYFDSDFSLTGSSFSLAFYQIQKCSFSEKAIFRIISSRD